MEHTKTKWKAGDELYGGEDYPVRCVETGQKVAMVYTGPDAAFIVQAVNSHEALVEALQQIDGMLVELNHCNYDADDVAEQNHSVSMAIQTARAALAKVNT